MNGAFILTGDAITVVVGATNYTLSRSHALFGGVLDSVREATKSGDWTEAVNKLNIANQFQDDASGGELTFDEKTGLVYWNGEPLHSSLADRITDMWRDGFSTQPLVEFCKNLFQNPVKAAIEELYDFLSTNKLPITTDGCFLAYKKVREDYMDCHTGTISNAVGEKPSMDRNQCDMDRENHCSSGLHFCGLSYLTCFGGERVMIVKVNPKDVTSIPSDYNFAKGRCCTYEVVEEYGGTDVQRFEAWSSSVADWDSNDYDEENNYEDDDYNDEDPEYEGPECEDPEQDMHEDLEEDLGAISNPIRRSRLAAGLTTVAVAEAMGITLNGLFRIECEGSRPSPAVVGQALLAINKLAKNFGEM